MKKLQLRVSKIYRWLWDSPTESPLSNISAARWVGALSATGSAVGLLITISLDTPSLFVIDYVANALFLFAGLLILIRAPQMTLTGTNAALACGTLIVSLQIATGYGKDKLSLMYLRSGREYLERSVSLLEGIDRYCHVST